MNHHEELTRALGRELHEQVDDLNPAPFVLGDVKVRAARIRRNRRLAAGAGLAAAVAIIVPAAMLAGLGPDRAGTLPGPATPGPSDGPAAHTTLTLDGLTSGDAPGIEYFIREGVVLPDEGLVEQETNWQGLVRSEADGGWLAYGPARGDVRYLSEEFEEQGESPATTDGLVTDADRSWVAWVARDSSRAQTLVLHSTTDPDAGRTWDFPGGPAVSPVGILDGGRVVFESTDQQTGRSTVAIAEPDGSISPLADVVGAVAVSRDGLVSVQTRQDGDFGACFGIVDTAVDATTVAWETCDNSLSVFSPDGRYVLAGPAYLDGAGDLELSIFDARTHREVAVFDQPRRGQVSLGQKAWESDTAVLAVATEGTRQAMLRLEVDGTLELATEVMEGGPWDDVLFWLGDERGRH